MYPSVLGSFDMKLDAKRSNIDSSDVERFEPKLGELDDGYWGLVGMRCNKLPTNGAFYCTVNRKCRPHLKILLSRLQYNVALRAAQVCAP